MSEQGRSTFDAALWFQWIMASTLGWLLGYLLLPNLPAISAGVGVGVLQWLVLHDRIPRAWRWVLVTALTWLGGSILLVMTVPTDLHLLLSGLFLGPVVGLAQWFILRREVHWAGWWIIISTLAWITGLTLLPGILTTGAMVGALTGLALELLLRHPTKTRIKGQWQAVAPQDRIE